MKERTFCMHPRSAVVIRFALLVWLHASATAIAEVQVELEVVTGERAPLAGAQRWAAVLNEAGVERLRIRAGKSNTRPGIKTVERSSSRVYRVTGVLTSKNSLRLPGESFSVRDVGKISAWFKRLRQDGPATFTESRAAFGLTGEQLVKLHKQLSVTVASTTTGELPADIVSEFQKSIPVPLDLSPTARVALAGQSRVQEEMAGISWGTAMAAVLRPLGLVLTPNRNNESRQVRLLITGWKSASESWPVGWPPDAKPRELAPRLFKSFILEINDRTVSHATEAIAERLEIPVLYDHNSMARHRIEPSQIKISFPRVRIHYKRALNRVLSKAHLTSEIRVDESEQPFIWIHTMKP